MLKFFVFVLMIFFHIVDDYYLQGDMKIMKQREWWKKNYPNTLYKYDYLMVLTMHSISWTFMIMLPIAMYYQYSPPIAFVIMFTINTIVHSVVDNFKANLFKINLMTDQAIHLLQIYITYLILMT